MSEHENIFHEYDEEALETLEKRPQRPCVKKVSLWTPRNATHLKNIKGGVHGKKI